ncbi:hypothetical protein ACHHYP_15312 [Achlya hypogyna]|uniref:Uncharacterized protein n=1 Tax=Achlya hypogyna TaxID=1202772 RepID=A0A1V9YB18_ACHHY|nr:hypothetical protein ACHHYP_15312 [Achlya hypogyna]
MAKSRNGKSFKVTAKPGTHEHGMQTKLAHDNYTLVETRLVAQSILEMGRKYRIDNKAKERQALAALDAQLHHLPPGEAALSHYLAASREMVDGVFATIVTQKGKVENRWLYLSDSLHKFKLKTGVVGKPSKSRFREVGKTATELKTLTSVTPFTGSLPPGYNGEIADILLQLTKLRAAKNPKQPSETKDANDAGNEGSKTDSRTGADEGHADEVETLHLVHIEFQAKPAVTFVCDSATDQAYSLFLWQKLHDDADRSGARPSVSMSADS